MRLSVMVLGFVCLCAVVIGIAAPVMQDEDVRGAFLTSRPKEKTTTSTSSSKPSRRRPKSVSPTKPTKPEKQPDKPGPSGPVGSSEPSKPGKRSAHRPRFDVVHARLKWSGYPHGSGSRFSQR